jgi:membrane-bound lytic murein transglycosylase F
MSSNKEAANISNIRAKINPYLKKTIFAQTIGLKRTFFPFLIMALFALSIGIGIYFITALRIPDLNNKKSVDFIVPQSDYEEDIDMVRVLLLFRASDYLVYKGTPIGFQYDMLKELEKELVRNVDIKVETKADKIISELYGGKYDIVIMDFTAHGFIMPFLERSIPHSYSYPVLVTGKKEDTGEVKPISVSYDFFANLFFAPDSPYSRYPVQRDDIHSTEELFEKVDNGEISYLICDYNEAITLIPFYSNVQILDKAGPQFERRWLLNKKNVQLNEDINHWLLDFKKTARYRYFIQKYFSPESPFVSTLHEKKHNTDISKYDAIIKKYAQQFGFDWRFVASIICQETKFISGLSGKGGSHGLMQLMPATMDYYGISEEDGEEANIRAGVQHLNSLRKSFTEITDEEEKLYFVAAAYNAGRGHIFDAQRLCAKNKEDFKKWENVSKYLKLKSNREIIADSAVKSGYFPGSHTVKYVHQVMERYFVYKVAYP